MLRVSILRTCGVVLCLVNTFSGHCVVLSSCIVILMYHVLISAQLMSFVLRVLIGINQFSVCIKSKRLKSIYTLT